MRPSKNDPVPFWVLRVVYDYAAAWLVDESGYRTIPPADMAAVWPAFIHDLVCAWRCTGRVDLVTQRECDGLTVYVRYDGEVRPWDYSATSAWREHVRWCRANPR